MPRPPNKRQWKEPETVSSRMFKREVMTADSHKEHQARLAAHRKAQMDERIPARSLAPATARRRQKDAPTKDAAGRKIITMTSPPMVEDVKVCKGCGKEIPPAAKFCANCGAKTEETAQA